MSSPRYVLDSPRSRRALLRGMDQMIGLLRPTLGPTARTVAVQGLSKTSAPEILDSAATIARRTIQLENPWEDMGGMIVRQMAWSLFEEVGDGAATAAVICQTMMHEATRLIAAGGDPMLMKRGIERATQVAQDELRRQGRTVELASEIARVILGTVRDQHLADMVGEVTEAVGPDGAVLVEDSANRDTVLDYIEGVRWNSGYHSYFLLKEGETSVRMMHPRILFTDHYLMSAEQLLPTLEACVAAGERNLMVVAPEISGSALALLIVNRDKGVLENVIAAKAPNMGKQREGALIDLATITGGRAICTERGDKLEEIILEDLGTARQAWVTATTFGILGGGGAKGAIRQRITEVKHELRALPKDEEHDRSTVQERIGKLAGAAAIIRVGAVTQVEQAETKLRIEAAVSAARSALRDGVVAGGGAGYVGCIAAVERLKAGCAGDEAFGVEVVARALSAPMRAIARNAGHDPRPLVHEARERGEGWTFDVLKGEWVEAWEVGIVDPLPVALAVLEKSASAATMALTTDVLIRHKKPKMATAP
jgi:chaperonin GroEL